MASPRTPRDENTREGPESLVCGTEFQSPLWLAPQNIQTTTSSTTRSPSDLTPTILALNALTLNTPSRPSHSTRMDDFEDSPGYGETAEADTSSADAPCPDLQSGPGDEKPRCSRSNVYDSFQRTIITSKMLQQVLGARSPEPYERPPDMPLTVEQRFVASLQEYGLDLEIQRQAPDDTPHRPVPVQRQACAGAALGKTVLEDIREEKESPGKASQKVAVAEGSLVDLTMNLPMWQTALNAVADTQAFADKDGINVSGGKGHLSERAANARPSLQSTIAQQDSKELNSTGRQDHSSLAHNRYAGFGSTRVLESSQPDRSTVNVDPALLATEDTGISSSQSSASTRNFESSSHGSRPKNVDSDSYLDPHDKGVPPRASSVPAVLFPSPRVEQEQSWDFVQKPNRSIAPHGFVPGGFSPLASANAHMSSPLPFLTKPQNATSLPHIAVQSPSPKKKRSKKRGPGSQHKIEPVQTKPRAADDTAGLPTLAANQEAKWKFKFPGNTYALLTILLRWSVKMQTLYRQLRDPYLFSINAAFPYPVSPPVYRKLVSVAFYDTSVTPHKEIQFIGHGDVSEISYNEVDVFSYPSLDANTDPDEAAHDSKVSAMKRALGLNPSPTTKELSDSQRAANGEGRWAYLLLQGPKSLNDGTPPHVIIAWHTSAVTSASECLHTIYPDSYNTPKPIVAAPKKGPKRSSSLQNLAAQYSASRRMHRGLRSASSSELPEADLTIPVNDGATTLKRRVWKMEKAGRIPLIEGYRVDVQKWGGWLDAVGVGKGKIIVWEERE